MNVKLRRLLAKKKALDKECAAVKTRRSEIAEERHTLRTQIKKVCDHIDENGKNVMQGYAYYVCSMCGENE